MSFIAHISFIAFTSDCKSFILSFSSVEPLPSIFKTLPSIPSSLWLSLFEFYFIFIFRAIEHWINVHNLKCLLQVKESTWKSKQNYLYSYSVLLIWVQFPAFFQLSYIIHTTLDLCLFAFLLEIFYYSEVRGCQNMWEDRLRTPDLNVKWTLGQSRKSVNEMNFKKTPGKENNGQQLRHLQKRGIKENLKKSIDWQLEITQQSLWKGLIRHNRKLAEFVNLSPSL